jgi:hypothetical protein
LGLISGDNHSGGSQHVLGTELMSCSVCFRCPFGMKDKLHEAAAITQIDEDEATVVATAMNPARNCCLTPSV